MDLSGRDAVDAVSAKQAVIDRDFAPYAGHDPVGCTGLHAGAGAGLSPFGQDARGLSHDEFAHLRWFDEGETNKTMKAARAGASCYPGYRGVAFEAGVAHARGPVERVRGTARNVMDRRTDGDWTITLTSLNEAVKQGTDQDK